MTKTKKGIFGISMNNNEKSFYKPMLLSIHKNLPKFNNFSNAGGSSYAQNMLKAFIYYSPKHVPGMFLACSKHALSMP